MGALPGMVKAPGNRPTRALGLLFRLAGRDLCADDGRREFPITGVNFPHKQERHNRMQSLF